MYERTSSRRHESHDPPTRRVLEQEIHVAVGSDRDVANASEPREQRLAVHDAIAVDDHAVELRGLQRSDDQVTLPARERLAVVDHEARYGRRRREVDDRALQRVDVELDVESVAVVDGRAVVLQALRDERPAVVLTGLQEIDLVAAALAHLGFPELARARVELEALGAPMTVRPDRRQRARDADERIVLRDRAVVVQPQDLAERHFQILHARELRAAFDADAQENVTLA